jgi:aspartyl-tRNA(Asn)/glutamyl-tRNA(Gln) amidotransferase subunit B
MEEGSLRAEANISVRPVGQKEFGTKSEVKNVASFSGVYKAIEFEIARQIDVIKSGGKVVQETRGWDADRGITYSQRLKESAHDYRYFPEPDLVPIAVDEAWEQRIRESLPELPAARRKRLEQQYSLNAYDANVITLSKSTADYYEDVVKSGADPKKASNWLTVELQALLTGAKQEITDCKVTPADLAGLIGLIESGTINGKMAKDLIVEMFETGKAPQDIVKEKGLVQITDTAEIEAIIRKVLADNPTQVEQFKSGKDKVFGFLVGQVMRATQGKANPQLLNDLLRQELSK